MCVGGPSRLVSIGLLLAGLLFAVPALAGEADDQYAVAAGHYSRGRWQLAVDEFEVFLKAYPQHAKTGDGRFFLGEALVQLHRLEPARQQFQQYLQHDPKGRFARQSQFRVGESDYLLGSAAAAKTELEGFAAQYPQDPLNAYVLPYLGNMALKSGDVAAAVGYFRQGLARYPDGKLQDDCRVGLGRALEKQGDREEAERYLSAVAGKSGSRLADVAQFQLGLLQFNAARYSEAVDTLAALQTKWPKSSRAGDARLARGWALYKLSRYDEAAKLFAGLSDDAALGVEARYWLGLTQLAQDQCPAAAKTLLAAAELNPQHRLQSALRAHAGDALLRSGDADGALTQFEKVLTHGAPASGDAWLDFALLGKIQVLLQHHDYAMLEQAAQEFARRFPDSVLKRDVDRILARALVEEKEYQRALALLEPLGRAETRSDEKLESQYLLALAQEGLKHYDEALGALGPVLEKSRGKLQADAQLTQGSLLVAKTQYAAAVAPLTKYLAGQPEGDNAIRARAELAICLARTGKLDQAKTLYGEIAGKKPPAELIRVATQQLSEAALDAGDTAWSAELFRRLAGEHSSPTQLQGLAGLAWSQFKAGRLAEAADTFEQVLAKHPEPLLAAEAALARGQALEQLGKNEAALAMYDLVVAEHLKSPFGSKALLAAARLRAKLRQFGPAAEQFQRFAETFPKAVEFDAVLYEWSWTLEDAGQHDQAKRRLQQLHDDCRHSRFWADATWRLAQRAFAAQQYVPAAALVKELLAQPHEPKIRAMAIALEGQIAAATENWQQVRQSFERLVNDFPDSPMALTARYWIAESLYRQKDYAEAEKRLRQLAREAVGRKESWMAMIPLRRAQILGLQKKWSAAYTLAANIEKDYPGFELQYEVDYLLGRCLADEANFEGARKAYRRAINSPTGAKTETAAKAQWFLGESYFHQKNYAAALREYLRLEILYAYPQWQSLALLEAAKCHELLGEWKEALEAYTRLLKEYPNTDAAKEAGDRRKVALQKQEVTQEVTQ
jgi:TolA-binding protein